MTKVKTLLSHSGLYGIYSRLSIFFGGKMFTISVMYLKKLYFHVNQPLPPLSSSNTISTFQTQIKTAKAQRKILQ